MTEQQRKRKKLNTNQMNMTWDCLQIDKDYNKFLYDHSTNLNFAEHVSFFGTPLLELEVRTLNPNIESLRE